MSPPDRLPLIRSTVLICLTLLPQLLSNRAAAEDLRCRGRLVSPDASTAEVEAWCGSPRFKHRRVTRRTEVFDDVEVESRIPVEVWTYDFGSTRLLKSLWFERGVLVRIRSEDARGGVEPSCVSYSPRRGDTIGQLWTFCGAPSNVDEWEEEITRYANGRPHESHANCHHSVVKHTIQYERWTYNLGPNRLQRIITLANGVVVKEESGRRGY